MPRGTLTFKQADVTRAVKAVEKAGLNVASAFIDKKGNIQVNVGEANVPAATPANPWDRVLKDENI